MRTDQHLDDPALAAWRVTASEYPTGMPLHDRLRFLVHYAVLAPSSHNSQPWAFRIATPTGGPGRIEVMADRARGLAVVDTDDRALVISVGAALEHLAIAACYFGFDPVIDVADEPAADPDLLAVLTVDDRDPHDERRTSVEDRATDADLFEAITARRTTRLPFEERSLPQGLLDRVRTEAHRFDVEASIVMGDDREHVAALVARGDRQQMADDTFRRELASWIRFNHSVRRDGMRGYGFGFHTLASAIGPLFIRTFDRGDQTAAHDRDLAQGAPALVVLSTATDDPAAWLGTGRALARVTLALTAAGATASYLNQPIEVTELRPRLAEVADVTGHPQLLLRAGYGPEVPAEPRRWLSEVVLDD